MSHGKCIYTNKIFIFIHPGNVSFKFNSKFLAELPIIWDNSSGLIPKMAMLILRVHCEPLNSNWKM